MKKFKKWLIDVEDSKIIKRSTFWNLIASLLNSFMSAILLFFVTRISGVDKAGIFTIASAFAYQCLSLGNFGVRNYHASDVKKDYKYSDYFYVRVISSILMYLLLIWCSFFKGYNIEKALIIFSFGIFKSIDCFEDLVQGEFQRKGRLDIGCILQSIRYLISILVFVLSLFITNNLIVSCIIVSIITLVLFLFLNYPIIKIYSKEKIVLNKSKVFKLFLACLPICIGNAINMYIANCPKYAIDNSLSSAMQAYYGILAMPVVIINLFSVVIYRPYVKILGDNWQSKNYKEFFKIVFRQVLVVSSLTVIVCLGGYILGLTIMEMIYGIKLHQYMLPFIILLFGGGLNALVGYFAVVLTAQRGQAKLFIGYLITFIVALILSNSLVVSFKILGAAILYVLLNVVTVILFTIFIFIKYFKSQNER